MVLEDRIVMLCSDCKANKACCKLKYKNVIFVLCRTCLDKYVMEPEKLEPQTS